MDHLQSCSQLHVNYNNKREVHETRADGHTTCRANQETGAESELP